MADTKLSCNNRTFDVVVMNISAIDEVRQNIDQVNGAAVAFTLMCVFITVEILASKKTQSVIMIARETALNSVDFIQINKDANHDKYLTVIDYVSENTLQRTAVLFLLVLLFPFLVLILASLYVVKNMCLGWVKLTHIDFVKGLDSLDVFWSLEDDTSRSIINVLGIIEAESSDLLVNKIKEKLQNISPNKNVDKIFYRRKLTFGFYYWTKDSEIDMNEYVQLIDFKCSESPHNLDKLMTKLTNDELPYSDQGLFQILITQESVKDEEGKKEFGIIFRIHHAVGDGIALIEFLCRTLANETHNSMFTNPDYSNNNNSTNDLVKTLKKLIAMPLCFVDGILRNPDRNALHGSELNGKKVFAWTHTESDILECVKSIKANIDEGRFSDVLVAALAGGLKKLYEEEGQKIPDNIAVVIPVRFSKDVHNDEVKLENDFSVTLLDVPIESDSRMDLIIQRCNALRRSADPLTNYYFLKLVGGVLPKHLLHPLLNSSQATMVFSNMPGPQELRLCGGRLSDLVFFVPHKGNTGLGVTALSYGGRLHFGAMADTALVSSSEQLSVIVQGMVDEIRKLYEEIVR